MPPDSSFLVYSFILTSTMETGMTKGCTCVCGLGLYICVTKGYTYVWLRAVRTCGYVLYLCVTKGYTHV